jgi:transcriptional regulator with XRE-family HTH domain
MSAHCLDPSPDNPMRRVGVSISESQRALIKESAANGNLLDATALIFDVLDKQERLSHFSYPSVSKLSQQEAISILRKISNVAMSTGDLSLVFGNNGKSGRLASKNYSLISKATGISRAHIGKVLKGENGASLRLLRLIAEVTDIDVDDVVRWLEEQKRKWLLFMSRIQKHLLVWFIMKSEASAEEWELFSKQYSINPQEMWAVMKQMERDQDSIEGK